MAENTNYGVVNTGNRPLVSYNFMLRVEGVFDVPCKSIRAFTKENNYEYIREGGLNDYVHMRRKPIDKPFTFQVERYCGTDWFDPMPNGTELALPVILLISRSHNNFDEAKRTFAFTGCTVMGKEYGQLDADKSGLLTETTTIAYREMMCLEIYSESDSGRFKFSGQDMEGNGVRYSNRNSNEMRKAQMEESAGKRQWKLSGDAYEGTGIRSAKYDTSEVRREQMQQQARRLWPSAGDVRGFV